MAWQNEWKIVNYEPIDGVPDIEVQLYHIVLVRTQKSTLGKTHTPCAVYLPLWLRINGR